MTRPALDPALDRTLRCAQDRREQRGWAGDAMVVVPELSPEEALALDGLLSLSRQRPVLPGQTLRVKLSTIETVLRDIGLDPRAQYERVAGRPLRDLPAESAAQRDARASFRSWLDSHPVVRARPRLAQWLKQAVGQGRVHSGMRPLVGQALRIVAALPASERVQRTVLAATLLDGDPHALDVGGPLHGLTVSLLVATSDIDPDMSAREVWARFGVLVDPVSSNVAALNLPPLGAGVAAAMAQAAGGSHVILSYGQLAASELRWPSAMPCFSCENPAVLIAAEQGSGPLSAPLICTSGRPSDAVRLLFSAVARSGGEIHHHGDFDEAGVQILRDLEARYGAVPWRFDVASLNLALAAGGQPSLDPRLTLEEAARTLPAGFAEELVVQQLAADLRVP